MNLLPAAWRVRRLAAASPGVPTLPLLALALLVLSLHAALLQFTPARFSFDEPITPRRFIARGILLQPLAGVPVPVMSQPAAAAITVETLPARPRSGPRTAPAQRVDAEVASTAQVRAPEQAASAVAPDIATAAAQGPVAALPATAASVASSDTPPAVVAAPAPAQANAPFPAQTSAAGPLVASAAAGISGEALQKPANLLIPGSIRLKYRVAAENQGLPLSASAELLWLHDGHRYEARFSVGNLLRTRVQTSRGVIGGLGLMPTRFSDKSGSERAAHFERAADGQGGLIVFSANSPNAALAPGAQDRLSLLLQLAAMLAGDPARYSAGSAIGLQVVGAREADVWVFKVEGLDTLNLPQGPTQTVKLARHPRRDYDQKVEVWLGVTMGYLPARIRITEPNGNFLDQTLEKLDSP